MLKRLLLLLLIAGCGDADTTRERETLRKAGFDAVEMRGWAPFACSKGDTFSTAFRARNPRGEIVEGVVCCGWVKSCTVRF